MFALIDTHKSQKNHKEDILTQTFELIIQISYNNVAIGTGCERGTTYLAISMHSLPRASEGDQN